MRGVGKMIKKILLGTYTRGDSQGIYQIDLDPSQKRLNNLQLVQEIDNPTYLSLNQDKTLLFSVVKEGDQGGVASFKKERDGSYQLQDKALQEGPAPCYLAYDQDRHLLYSANYHLGSLQVYRVDPQGQISLTDSLSHQGSGPHPNQEAPHAHYFDQSPDGNYLISCDLGTDQVQTYQVNQEGKISQIACLDLEPGSGPRHLAFHPDGSHAYLFTELTSQIYLLNYQSDQGSFKILDQVSSLPEDFEGENSGAAIKLTQDGKYLYASNRGHNSLVTYQIQDNYTLTDPAWTPTYGQTPRDFTLSLEEDLVLVGHQDQNVLTLFERKAKDGRLSLLEKDVYAPEVVCLKFLN